MLGYRWGSRRRRTAEGGGGQQRAAGDGRSRAGTMGRDSPWFRGVRHTRYPLTARARDRRDERAEVTPHALPQGAEPRQTRFTSRHRPQGDGRGQHFEGRKACPSHWRGGALTRALLSALAPTEKQEGEGWTSCLRPRGLRVEPAKRKEVALWGVAIATEFFLAGFLLNLTFKKMLP